MQKFSALLLPCIKQIPRDKVINFEEYRFRSSFLFWGSHLHMLFKWVIVFQRGSLWRGNDVFIKRYDM